MISRGLEKVDEKDGACRGSDCRPVLPGQVNRERGQMFYRYILHFWRGSIFGVTIFSKFMPEFYPKKVKFINCI